MVRTLKTVNSLSGGKTSSYMGLKYPTDYYVFAVVLTSHELSAPTDKALLREAQNKIPWFRASHESDLTLKNMLDLEQEIGKEVKWVASPWTMEEFIYQSTDLPRYRSHGKPMLPNRRTRFCSQQLKILPIFEYLYFNCWKKDPLLMNIGFRWDEPKRAEKWSCKNDIYKLPKFQSLSSRKTKYKKIELRISNFPLYHDRITRKEIGDFWNKKGWKFPEISNCRFCFFHSEVQLQLQAQREPNNLNAWLEIESNTGNTFGDRALKEILRQPILDVFDDSRSCACSD